MYQFIFPPAITKRAWSFTPSSIFVIVTPFFIGTVKYKICHSVVVLTCIYFSDYWWGLTSFCRFNSHSCFLFCEITLSVSCSFFLLSCLYSLIFRSYCLLIWILIPYLFCVLIYLFPICGFSFNQRNLLFLVKLKYISLFATDSLGDSVKRFMKTSLNAFVFETGGSMSTCDIHSSRCPKFHCLWQERKIPGARYLFPLTKHQNRTEETWIRAPVLRETSCVILDKSLTLPGFQFPHL